MPRLNRAAGTVSTIQGSVMDPGMITKFFCPSCGLEHLELRRFCNRCGTNLEVIKRALTSGLASGSEFDVRRARRRILAHGFLLFSIGPAFGIFCLILREVLEALGIGSAWILNRVALFGPFGMLVAVLWTIYQFIAFGTRDPQLDRAKVPQALRVAGDLPATATASDARAPQSVTEATTYSLRARASLPPRSVAGKGGAEGLPAEAEAREE